MKARVDLLKRTTAVPAYQPPREPSQLVIWPGGETGFDPSIWDRHMRERLFDYCVRRIDQRQAHRSDYAFRSAT